MQRLSLTSSAPSRIQSLFLAWSQIHPEPMLKVTVCEWWRHGPVAWGRLWKEIRQDASHSQSGQLLKLAATEARPSVGATSGRAAMIPGAAVFRRADDENADSGAETAEWVQKCRLSISSGLMLASQLSLAVASMETNFVKKQWKAPTLESVLIVV